MIKIAHQIDLWQQSSAHFKQTLSRYQATLQAELIHTTLGTMIAIGNDSGLYFFEFIDKNNIEKKITKLMLAAKSSIIEGTNHSIESITFELNAYFNNSLKKFHTPVHLLGTDFQKLVWQELMLLEYGATASYASQAKAINKPAAYRAVANAHANNLLLIIVPCHRVVRADKSLGGYGAGVIRKQRLLDHERQCDTGDT